VTGKFDIAAVHTSGDLAATATLFQAYAASLPIDLGYQDFEAELATLPGKYAPPAGALLLARDASGCAVGCVALRPMEPAGCCEMKRLYVAPEGRGLGLGRALVEAITGTAARLGYREIRLDTLPTMTQALSLYGKSGFEPVPAYYATPIAGTIFLARRL
jgi:GNAT superfamily N-acetyltransferase